MKTIIVYLATLSLVLNANGQAPFKKLNVNTTYFEEMPPSSFDELTREQRAKGEKFSRHFNIVKLRPNNKNQRVYRLRETGEVVTISKREAPRTTHQLGQSSIRVHRDIDRIRA